MRAALAAAGARLLEAVRADDDGYVGPHAKCGAGHQASYAGSRPKTVSTVLGPVQAGRAWYHCAGCEHGFAPRDEQLGVAGTSLSPGLTEMIARAGAEVPSGKAAALLEDLAGVAVSARTVERSAEASGAAARTASAAEAAAIRARTVVPLPPAGPVPDMLYAEVDDTGVSVRASETEGRPGKDGDRQAGTREVKLAGFFTVSRLDDDGRPVTDPGSSTYVATFDGKDAVAGLTEAEYLRAAGTTSARSSPSATAPPGSGPWPRPCTRTPPTSRTSTTPASTCTTSRTAWPSSPPTRPSGWPGAARN